MGDTKRAELIAHAHLDPDNLHIVKSHRGFVTYTGTYKGSLVSIVATGMGRPMMDFMVRECRAVVSGPMAIVRLGTAGGPNKDIVPGTIVCASKGSVLISKVIDAESEPFYSVSKVCPPSDKLSDLVRRIAFSQP